MLVKIKNCIFKIIYILVTIYLLIFVPTIWGEKPLVVISGSMEPTLKVGGILYYEKIVLNDFKEGDILVYELNEHTISHRIVDITDNGFLTKGDNNNSIDTYEVENMQVIGKGTNWSIPYIGYYADFVYNHKYLLFISVGVIIIDLLVDSYKWLRLSQYADDEASRSKYKQISDTLYDMFMEEHQHIGEMFKS